MCQLKCHPWTALFVHFGLPSGHCIRSAISLKNVTLEAFSCTFRCGNFLRSPTRTSCLLVFPGSFVSPFVRNCFACTCRVRWFSLSSFFFSFFRTHCLGLFGSFRRSTFRRFRATAVQAFFFEGFFIRPLRI